MAILNCFRYLAIFYGDKIINTFVFLKVIKHKLGWNKISSKINSDLG